MGKYPISDDFKFVRLLTFPVIPQVAPIAEKVLGALVTDKSTDKKIKITKRKINVDGGKIDVLIFEPNDCPSSSPALVYFHGGGFIYKAAPYHYSLAKKYCLGAACKVIMPDYRLTPKFKYPIPFNDCIKTLEWVADNARLLGINPAKIAVGGDSAGGCLAAGAALWARDSRLGLCAQMLVYPVTDRTMTTDSMKKYTDTPVWNARLSKKMWQLYMPTLDVENIGYASPALNDDLTKLPDAYVELAQYDSLHDEGLKYAKMLEKHGTSVLTVETAGTIHGFDMAQNSPIVIESIGKRCDFLRKAFADK